MEAWLIWLSSLENRAHLPIEALLPVFKEWMDRSWGSLSFHWTQLLTGHGCLGEYLGRIGREPDDRCHHCDAQRDDSIHTLAECPTWGDQRNKLCQRVGTPITHAVIINNILSSREKWDAFEKFCLAVMREKEAAERMRESTRTLQLQVLQVQLD